MSITYTLTDASTGREIKQDNIIMASDAGVVELYGANSMRFTPVEQVESKPAYVDGAYEIQDKPKLPERPNLAEFTPKSSTGRTVRTAYYFGIDAIEASLSKYERKSAYLSPYIEIGSASYIELEVKQNRPGRIEFYILDGNTENAILPLGDATVQDEKLFWNLPTRFTINQNKPVVIKKNGIATTMTLDSIDSEDFGPNTFSISYSPTEQSHRYVPKNSKVRIKVIQRCEEDEVPAVIQSMVIHKHGGDGIWNIKA